MSTGAGQVVMGTCGWSSSDAPWAKPPTGTSAADKLRMYSGPAIGFGCVEVDTSTYQIVNPAHVAKWCAATPPGFVFCFKMFGFICAKGGQLGGQFPRDIQDMLPPPLANAPKGTRIEMPQVPGKIIDEIWRRFHLSIEPARVAQKLGPVLFQFHLGFDVTDANRRHVEWCRARLGADIRMAVEFRDRAWVDGSQLGATVCWLRSLGIALAASDDLQHELLGGRGGSGESGSGESHVRLPIIARAATPDFGFARVHRRAGSERLLDGTEIAEWASLLRRWRDGAGESEGEWIGDVRDPALKGPIYFLWGTDHKDQCVTNAAALCEALGEQCFDWKQHLQEVQSKAKGGLAGFLAKGKKQQEERKLGRGDSGNGREGCGRPEKAAHSNNHDTHTSSSGAEGESGGRGGGGGQGERRRRTTDVGALDADGAAADAQQTASSSGSAACAGSGGASSGSRSHATDQQADRAAAAAAAATTAAATAGTRQRQRQALAASAAPAAASRPAVTRAPAAVPSVPPAREAAFLAVQRRASSAERAVDPAVFRSLPAEIRAELVTAWWNARPDVIAARKWAAEALAKQQQQQRQQEGKRRGIGEDHGGGGVKRARRGSSIGAGASSSSSSGGGGGQGRSIRDFLRS
jgi:uncharacterized protein YecE (DUF72 family)